MSGPITPAQFVAKWSRVTLSERAASQEHFIDLCRMLGQPTPAEQDATGAEYTFEKGVTVTAAASRGSGGDRGFADVWWRGKFAWEYKRKGKYRNLNEAYRQLCQYREALENPPLLVVSDIARTEIHSNFTGTAKQVHIVELENLADPGMLDLLRRVFTAPNSFKPTLTADTITEEVARQFGTLAQGLRDRGHDPHEAAHFLMKCMFCLFAEDVDLLRNKVFERLVASRRDRPETLTPALTDLFNQMRTGGSFGVEEIPFFNGGLFDESPGLDLTAEEIGVLLAAAKQDWASVEPAIFGTLFERSLDPNTRAQIGAHYTSRDDILLVVEPVILAPLRREWDETKGKVDEQIARRRKARTKATKAKADAAAVKLLQGFVERLASLRILDPACGSGNFLYVAIQRLLDLEKEVITYAAELDVGLLPQIRPTQLHGIEINAYAAELAQVVIWIGYLQWMHDNGFLAPRDPILEPLQTIECRDAILELSDPANPHPAEWPEADFIIGNPPFLGSKLFRQQGLEDSYIQAMYDCFDLPNGSDLCCYWFELARRAIESRSGVRAGLLATQGIRGGSSRKVVERIKQAGDVFMAWSDRKWVLDGAAVHVSILGFDNGSDDLPVLDGQIVERINSDLSGGADISTAQSLKENQSIAFMGDTKGGAFDIGLDEAKLLLQEPNPNGRKSSDVMCPWINGLDITRRPRSMWILDFGCDMRNTEASGYEGCFRIVEERVWPKRKDNRRAAYAKRWWLHVEPRPAMRKRIEYLDRYIATPNLTKFRLFKFVHGRVLPDHQLIAFARSDDYFFGVLHSSIHELWARRTGTQLREAESGFRYTPTTCFETFALPWAPGSEPRDSSRAEQPRDMNVAARESCDMNVTTRESCDTNVTTRESRDMNVTTRESPAMNGGARGVYDRISEAARELNEQRERWLNPPEWIEPIAAAVDAEDDFADVPEEARSLIRESAIMARAAKDKNLKKRTLTNLYNERPTWLKLAHEKLDRAVLAAYAHVDPQGGWNEDWAVVWAETGAGQPLPADHALTDQRKDVDDKVLANLLRMNLDRAT